MAREEKRVVALDEYEHGIVIHALNDMRTEQLEENQSTDVVDEVLLKVIDAPTKRVRRSRDEAR